MSHAGAQALKRRKDKLSWAIPIPRSNLSRRRQLPTKPKPISPKSPKSESTGRMPAEWHALPRAPDLAALRSRSGTAEFRDRCMLSMRGVMPGRRVSPGWVRQNHLAPLPARRRARYMKRRLSLLLTASSRTYA